MKARSLVGPCLASLVLAAACGDDGTASDTNATTDGQTTSGGTTTAGSDGTSGTTTAGSDSSGEATTATTSATSSGGETTGPGETDSDTDTDTDTDTGDTGDTGDTPAICDSPLDLYDTSSPTVVIGSGTPESCTGQDLKAAAELGGTITFDCGPDPVTIALDETIVLPINTDTIIDGEGLVTLDAGGKTRHFFFNHPDWMNNPTRIVLQRMTFTGGKAPVGEYFDQDPQNPKCAYGYKEGSGGVIYVRNGVLHVIDSRFENNEAALVGPDVGGGAIYVVGVPEVTISGSRFVSNRAANGGAIGMLFANPLIYNSHFEDNTAEGIGQNYVEPGCPNFNHDEQGGAGGNSGAVYFDGLNDEDHTYVICGTTFVNNRANELGGALFRTPNIGKREMLLDRDLFDANTGRLGGVSFIKDNHVTVQATTFMNNRSGVNVMGEELGGPLGGLWINNGSADVENSTFYNNNPTGLDVSGDGGTVTNATFVGGRPQGVSVNNSLFVDVTCPEALSGANNLQWPEASACVAGISFADPGLGAIGDNGGPTPTAAPAADGAAEGVGSGCPGVDQRGEPRDPNSCAAGAVEP
ncbi:MAG: choice-of-anchor Q domain-containing protein [Nannocystaceae bacterium]